MIPKAHILALAKEDQLRNTTVQKDYVLGWLLFGIAQHPLLSRWVFKGGTCLKKCFFETYRFSEDLDFTVPSSEQLSEATLRQSLTELAQWVHEESGVIVPTERIGVERYTNKQGTESYNAKLFYSGPLGLPRSSQPRIKFDITQHEVLVDPPDHREVFHGYRDALAPTPKVACYSVNEVLAEKTRALYERKGRARDVYDVVHISRNFRAEISAEASRRIVAEKFSFKGLPLPTPQEIVERIDSEGLKANWDQQLRHQLPRLPSLEGFVAELLEAIVWWMDPNAARPAPRQLRPGKEEQVLPRVHFRRPWATRQSDGVWLDDAIRFAARNRLLARFSYHGSVRTVEPYSLRRKQTGNVLLYAYEVDKDGAATDALKAYKVQEISSGEALDVAFSPRWAIEL